MRHVFLLILASVVLSSFAQVALKAGMSADAVQRAIDDDSAASAAIAICFSPLIILGLALYFGSALIWLFVLSKVELSFAYPFVALGFVLTAVFGKLIFHDSFSTNKVAGTALIMVGVLILARG